MLGNLAQGNSAEMVKALLDLLYTRRIRCVFFGGGPSSWNVYAMDQVETNIFQCI